MNNRQTNDFGQAFVAFTGGFKNPFSHSTLSKKRLFLILAALTLVILGFSSYVLLIPLNFENAEFRRLLTVLLLLWSLPLLFPSTSPKEKKKLFKSPFSIPLLLAILFIITNIIVGFFTSPLFENLEQEIK